MLLILLQIGSILVLYSSCAELSFSFMILSIIIYNVIGSVSLRKKKISAKDIYDLWYMICFITIWLLLLCNTVLNSRDIMAQFVFWMLYVYWRKTNTNCIHIEKFSVQIQYTPWVVFVLSKISSLFIACIIGFWVGQLYIILKYISMIQ